MTLIQKRAETQQKSHNKKKKKLKSICTFEKKNHENAPVIIIVQWKQWPGKNHTQM